MAQNDIVVWKSPHGGHAEINRGYLDASETFLTGEPVRVTADGTISESPDDPTNDDIIGISAGPGSTAVRNPETNANYTTNDNVFYSRAADQTLFATQNFATDGAGTQAAPAQTNIGDEAGLTLASGVWSLDVGTTNNVCRIEDVLNSQKDSIVKTGETLTAADEFWVVFRILAHQDTHDTGAVNAPPAA